MTIPPSAAEIDSERELLDDDTEDSWSATRAASVAPAFTDGVLKAIGDSALPQRALYGRLMGESELLTRPHGAPSKLYVNVNAPFSAVVCGVQGSGKSHSTAVLLEGCLMADSRIGRLPAPLSALVLHFDTAAGGGSVRPCEAAYLSALDPALRDTGVRPPDVTVLVMPANLKTMRKVYESLPHVRVEPLRFASDDISGGRLLEMMKLSDGTPIAYMPLYMESIMMILRSMQDDFDYAAFRDEVDKSDFDKIQKAMLKLRLALLDECLKDGNASNSVRTHFKKGQLTIVDLSSRFMDAASACGFFDMILGLFIETDVDVSGKIVVLDEAHKYLSETRSGSSARLTDSLLTVIRQQRHCATRVIISTQEPTVVPSAFFSLCQLIIAHRFTSPAWLRVLAKHVSMTREAEQELLTKIIKLSPGEGFIFAANALYIDSKPHNVGGDKQTVAVLGKRYFHVRSRRRLTRDGGHSLLAVPHTPHSTPPNAVATEGSDGPAVGVYADVGVYTGGEARSSTEESGDADDETSGEDDSERGPESAPRSTEPHVTPSTPSSPSSLQPSPRSRVMTCLRQQHADIGAKFMQHRVLCARLTQFYPELGAGAEEAIEEAIRCGDAVKVFRKGAWRVALVDVLGDV